MPGMIDFANLDLRAALDFAIMVEEDAQLRYRQLAESLGDDAEAAQRVFRMMAVNEGKHRQDLQRRRAALGDAQPTLIEISVLDAAVERPEPDGDELPRTERGALELALAAEKRGLEFYRDVASHSGDAGAREFFLALMREEIEHVALLAAKLAALGPAPVGAARDREPARASPAARGRPCPDRAALESVLPRFDAATRAVATAVLVQGMDEGEVAEAFGVSRRTVARKVTRFLEVARQFAAVTIAAAALGACDGGPVDAPERMLAAESPRSAQAEQLPLPECARAAAPGERGSLAHDDQAEAGRELAPLPAAEMPREVASDLEYTAGLDEPPQSQVMPPGAPWRRPAGADLPPLPVIDDVWPDKGPSSGGDRIVIRGRDLRAVRVLFGFTPATILSATDQEVTVAAPPAGAGEVRILVTTRDGNYVVAGTTFRYYT